MISSLTTSWTLFRIIFPVTYGFMVGFTYMVHLYLTWRYIPGQEGFLTGIVNAGFGCGGFVFTYLSNVLINPDGVEPSKDPSQKPFPRSVANNLPKMLQTLLIVWTSIWVFALLTI